MTHRRRQTADSLNAAATSNALPAPAPAAILPVAPAASKPLPGAVVKPIIPPSQASNTASTISNIIIMLFYMKLILNKYNIASPVKTSKGTTNVDDFVVDGDDDFLASVDDSPTNVFNNVPALEEESDR